MSTPVKTGFILNPTASQYFVTGDDSGSIVNLDFDVSLYVSESSFVTLNNKNFYYKIFDTETCPLPSVCSIGKIINVLTGSLDGQYTLQYSTQSATGVVSASVDVAGTYNFNESFGEIEQFTFTPTVNASGTGSILLNTGINNNKVYFRYFNSCSVESRATPTHVLDVTPTLNELPLPSIVSLQVEFDLNSVETYFGIDEYIGDEYGNPYNNVTSIAVTVTSDSSTSNNTSFTVTSAGPIRTVLLQAGETATFTLSYNGIQQINAAYRFDKISGFGGQLIGEPILDTNGSDIFGKIDINSTIFPNVSRNFGEGYFTHNPQAFTVAVDPELDNTYSLKITLGGSDNMF